MSSIRKDKSSGYMLIEEFDKLKMSESSSEISSDTN